MNRQLLGACGAVVVEAGTIALEGPAHEVLAEPRVRELGVAEPGRLRILRRAREAGIGQGQLRALEEAIR